MLGKGRKLGRMIDFLSVLPDTGRDDSRLVKSGTLIIAFR